MSHPERDGLRWLLASMIAAMIPLHVALVQLVRHGGPEPAGARASNVEAAVPAPDGAPSTASDRTAPSEAEWQAIARFEASKDAAYGGDRPAVDAGLTSFHHLAVRHPADVGVRRIDLMALRQAIDYAREGGRAGRARELEARFEERARTR